MAFSVIQAGTTLKLMSDNGVVSAALTLPTGVTLDASKAPRWAVFNEYVVLVNTPSRPLTIDAKGIVRPLCLLPPAEPATLTTASGGSLTGTYLEKNTFVILDEFGNIIAESDLGPVSNSQAVATQYLRATQVPVSLDAITARRLYRTTTNGAVFFQWVDLDGNVLTAVQDDLSDAGLSTVAQPVLGTCPHIALVAEWRGRLWGVSEQDHDQLRYSEAGIMYSWPSDNELIVPPKGVDTIGVTSLLPRREELGVGRLNQLVKIVGTAAETVTGDVDISPVIISRECGVLSQDSCALYRDTWYFLWYDGVYQWGPDGLRCISNGKEMKGVVRAWFTTDSFFNRARFPFATGFIDPIRYKYILILAAAGSTSEDRWVEYDIEDGTWWGPHKTAAFSPACGFNTLDASNVLRPLMGSIEGDLWAQQDTRTDGTLTPIAFDVIGKRHAMDEPNDDKFFGQITLIGKNQSAGILTVRSRTGDLSETAYLDQSYDMTKSRQRLGRLGVGRHTQLEFINEEVNQDVEIYSYEIEPVHRVGRR
jgi:hypothetical protein